jgi:hypothetical protein
MFHVAPMRSLLGARPPRWLSRSDAGRLHRHEAGAAIDRTIAARFERHRRRHPALRTDCFEHFARTAARRGAPVSALRLSRIAAIAAPLRFVFEAFFRVELLIADRKIELGAAIFACENLVFHREPSGTTPAGQLET